MLGGVLGSPAARDLLALLGLLAAEAPDPTSVARTFGRLWGELAAEPDPILADAWRAHLVGRLLDDENPFSLSAERGDTEGSLGALVEPSARSRNSSTSTPKPCSG